MSESMIERVAKAHYETEFTGPWEAATEDLKQAYLTRARISIEAMRKPTDAMVDAGYAFTADPCFREDFISAWNAAIEEAIK